MALTLTRVTQTVMGNKQASVFKADFDSSYPTGGESLTGVQVGISTVEFLLAEPKGGYYFEYDHAGAKLKAYGAKEVPALVVEEAVTVATNVGTLANVPFYIVAIDVTGGTVTGAFNIIPTQETPLTKQCAVTLTSGLMTFLGTDAVTTVKVTYIPLQNSGPFSESNRVVDEVVVAAAAKTALANRAVAIQYVWDNTDNVLNTFEPVGEAPTATHNCVVDITNGSSTTDLDGHADDEGNSLKVTYVKYSALPVACCIDDADTTLSSEAYDFTAVGGYPETVIPGLGTQVCGETGAAGNAIASWKGPSGTAANLVSVWNPFKNRLVTANTTAIATLAMPFFILDRNLITNISAKADEAVNGTDLSAVTGVRIFAFG
jgi:hypothetical protein